MYPRKLHERWQEEYKAFETTSERDDWVAQRVEERKAIKAVRVMKGLRTSLTLYFPLACQTLRKMGKVHETGSRDGKDGID